MAAIRYYVIREGDKLSGLAIKFYGDASKWRMLGDTNNITDPRKLRVGMRIRY